MAQIATISSLKNSAMELVLRHGIRYSHILPRLLSKDVTIFFFDTMFEDSVQNFVELTETVADDPHADVADREELLSIIRMFSIVGRDQEVPVEDRHVQATSELIGIAGLLSDNLESEPFQKFTEFLEQIIVMFIDDDFVLPSHEDYHVDFILYHIRHAIN